MRVNFCSLRKFYLALGDNVVAVVFGTTAMLLAETSTLLTWSVLNGVNNKQHEIGLGTGQMMILSILKLLL